MKHKVVAPSVGESITEVSILKWAKSDGQAIKVGDVLLEIESDKATVEIVAEQAGVLKIMKQAGERLPIGAQIGEIDDAGTPTATASAASSSSSAPRSAVSPPPLSAQPASGPSMSPAVRKAVTERGLDVSQIPGTGKDGRVTKGDVAAYSPGAAPPGPAQTPRPATPAAPAYIDRPGDRRVPMTMLRARIAERLVQAQHTAAILTTFNEADMGPVMELRNKHKDAFKAKHGVALSFMSFFTLGCIEALKVVPEVNASIDGRDIIYHDYFDIGIAVGTERGLVVPVVRGADTLGLVGLEKKIAELAVKARDSKLSIADLSGGTFTISNGGVYGSLLSTPILNPPQSGILGMHKIQERPIAVNGKVEIRPMMYLALSYDHRIIDGKGAVTFLVALKEILEHPEKLKLEL
jgi:2-oxoglutarate dehydrogenase E2 component (dihydrolipoamide succinyltransferase)